MYERHCFISILLIFFCSQCFAELEEINTNNRFKIEGKVVVPFTSDSDWIGSTTVLVDGGAFLGFVKSDGSFVINNVPSGSYVVDIANPTYMFEPVRIDINQKGKIRARRVNNVQPQAVSQLSYPLKYKARAKTNYFQQREQWRITDMLFNPMVMMMILPFLVIMVLPKLMNTADPETQKEMQSQMNMLNPKQNMPELSELMAGWFGGGAPKKPVKSKPLKSRRN